MRTERTKAALYPVYRRRRASTHCTRALSGVGIRLCECTGRASKTVKREQHHAVLRGWSQKKEQGERECSDASVCFHFSFPSAHTYAYARGLLRKGIHRPMRESRCSERIHSGFICFIAAVITHLFCSVRVCVSRESSRSDSLVEPPCACVMKGSAGEQGGRVSREEGERGVDVDERVGKHSQYHPRDGHTRKDAKKTYHVTSGKTRRRARRTKKRRREWRKWGV